MTEAKPQKKTLRGTVVKTAMKDTMTVAVTRYVKHSKYKKYFKTTKKFLVHDAGNTAHVDDLVDIVETRPMSKRKHFALLEIVRKATVAEEK